MENNNSQDGHKKKKKEKASCSFWCCAPNKVKTSKKTPTPIETPKTQMAEVGTNIASGDSAPHRENSKVDINASGQSKPDVQEVAEEQKAVSNAVPESAQENALPPADIPATPVRNETASVPEQLVIVQDVAQPKEKEETKDVLVNEKARRDERETMAAESSNTITVVRNGGQCGLVPEVPVGNGSETKVTEQAMVASTVPNERSEKPQQEQSVEQHNEILQLDEIFPVIQENVKDKSQDPVLPGHNLDGSDNCFELAEDPEEDNTNKVRCADANAIKQGTMSNILARSCSQVPGKHDSFRIFVDERLYTNPVNDSENEEKSEENKLQLLEPEKVVPSDSKEPENVDNAANVQSPMSPEVIKEQHEEAPMPEQQPEIKAPAELPSHPPEPQQPPTIPVPAQEKAVPLPDPQPAAEVIEIPLPKPKPHPQPEPRLTLPPPTEVLDKSVPIADSRATMPRMTSMSPRDEGHVQTAKEEVKTAAAMPVQESSNYPVQIENSEDVDISRSVRESYALPTPTYNTSSRRSESDHRTLSRAPSESIFSVVEEKNGGNVEINLQQAIQERDMLWAAIDKVDMKLKENSTNISRYQSQIEYLKKYIARTSAHIRQAKSENVYLQQEMNSMLLVKLNQYPLLQRFQ